VLCGVRSCSWPAAPARRRLPPRRPCPRWREPSDRGDAPARHVTRPCAVRVGPGHPAAIPQRYIPGHRDGFILRGPLLSDDGAGWVGCDHPGSLSHGGSQGFKSPHLHPQHCRSGRRRSHKAMLLPIAGPRWGRRTVRSRPGPPRTAAPETSGRNNSGMSASRLLPDNDRSPDGILSPPSEHCRSGRRQLRAGGAHCILRPRCGHTTLADRSMTSAWRSVTKLAKSRVAGRRAGTLLRAAL
jgi:hypothetical protein